MEGAERLGAALRAAWALMRACGAGAVAAATACAGDDPAAGPPCASGEVLDGTSCVPQACGTGPFRNIDRTGPLVFHVMAGSDPSVADGSEARPYAHIQRAIDAAVAALALAGDPASVARVAIAGGVYREALDAQVPAGSGTLELVGRCSALLRVDRGYGPRGHPEATPPDGPDPVLEVLGGPVSVAGVTLTGGRYGVGVTPAPLAAPPSLSFRDSVVEDCHHAGIVCTEGSNCVVMDVQVTDIAAVPEDGYGTGLVVENGANAVLERVLIARTQQTGLLIADATASAVGLEIRDVTIPSAEHPIGYGIVVADGALDAADVRIERSSRAGMQVFGAGTFVTLDGVRIAGTTAAGTAGTLWPVDGRAIDVEGGAFLVASDLVIEGGQGIGLFAAEAGTIVQVAGAEIRDVRPLPDGRWGRGLEIGLGASLTASEVTVEGVHDVGILVSDSGSSAILQGVAIQGTRASVIPGSGVGMVVQVGGLASGSALAIRDSAGPGIYASGLGQATFDGVLLERNGFAGLAMLDAGVALTSSSIRDSIRSPSHGGGLGVFAWADWGRPELLLQDVEMAGHALAGAWLRGPGLYHFAGGSISASGSGALPGGVVATEGVQPWRGEGGGGPDGLGLFDVAFADLPGGALLLDESSGAFDGELSDCGEEPLRWQHCDGVEAPDFHAWSEEAYCRPGIVEVSPAPGFAIYVDEGPVETR